MAGGGGTIRGAPPSLKAGADNLARALAPRSIAVIGASADPSKRGHHAVKSLIEGGFDGDVYPVNLALDSLLGLPVFPNVADLPAVPDLAFIALPADRVAAAAEACGEAGVAGAIAVAVGFGESGALGLERERRLRDIATTTGLRIIGPNTNGVVVCGGSANLVGASVPRGDLALVAQSGNVAVALWNEARHLRSAGFSHYVGLGNQVDVAFEDCIEVLADHPDITGAVAYIESVRDGRRLLEAVNRFVQDRPLVVFVSGRTSIGSRTTLSHTGALASRSHQLPGLLREAGATVVERSDELLPVAITLAGSKSRARNVAILADGGGHATIAADAVATHGSLDIPTLGAKTRKDLDDLLGPAASTRNPVDVAGASDRDPAVLADALELILADDRIDACLMTGVIGGYGRRFGSAEIAAREDAATTQMIEIARRSDKRVVVHSAYAFDPTGPLQRLADAGVPVVSSLDVAASAVSALAATRAPRLKSVAPRPAAGAGRAPRFVSEDKARERLEAEGVLVADWAVCTSGAAATAAARRWGSPVALRVASEEIVHKSAVGGVELGVAPADAEQAYKAVIERVRLSTGVDASAVIATPMAHPGAELILGFLESDVFGPLVTIGRGGTSVEAAADAVFAPLPASRRTLTGLLRRYAPSPPHELVAFADRAAAFFMHAPDALELEFNPVIVGASGFTVADVRLVTRS